MINKIDLKAFLLALILSLFLIAFGFFAGQLIQIEENNHLPFESGIVEEVYTLIHENGLLPIPTSPKMEYGMIRGMIEAYGDPYTYFSEPPQSELQTDTLEGKFGGIGARIEYNLSGQVILFPLPSGPAQEAGVQDGDILVAIDTWQLEDGSDLSLVEAALRGPVGEEIQVSIFNSEQNSILEFTLSRIEIPLPSVTYHIFSDNPLIAVIEINVISENTPDEISKAITTLINQGCEFFVLDLRSNYGGLLTSAIEISRLFLGPGLILVEEFKDLPKTEHISTTEGKFIDLPLIVLIDNNTASAAEIIVAGIKAHKRGVIVGTGATYGKDKVQLLFELSDGSSFQITHASWSVPGLNENFAEKGIEPDLLLPGGTSQSELIFQAFQSIYGE